MTVLTPTIPTKHYISKIDGAEFDYRVGDNILEVKFDGCDWSDFSPSDRRAYSQEEYAELLSLLEGGN